MAEQDSDELQRTSKQHSALGFKKIKLTDTIVESAEVSATETPGDTVGEAETVAQNEADEQDQTKFFEIINHDTKSGGEAYIDYVFENYKPVSPRSANYLDIIRSSFAQPRFRSHFENVVENSKSHYQTCDYIRSVVDDVLQDLLDSDFEMQTPLSATEHDFLKTTMTDRVVEQHVNRHVAKIVHGATKQIEQETKHASFIAKSINAAELEASKMKKSWSLENIILESPALETTVPSPEIPKTKKQDSIYANLPQYLPAFRPHLDSTEYVTIPYLYNLPSYTKAPFPACHKNHSATSWRTTRLGHSVNPIPTIHPRKSTTQIYSKLIKYYNSFK
ncbi:hypothetical protein BsWGS_01036 [Bradybaena similaris]